MSESSTKSPGRSGQGIRRRDFLALGAAATAATRTDDVARLGRDLRRALAARSGSTLRRADLGRLRRRQRRVVARAARPALGLSRGVPRGTSARNRSSREHDRRLAARRRRDRAHRPRPLPASSPARRFGVENALHVRLDAGAAGDDLRPRSGAVPRLECAHGPAAERGREGPAGAPDRRRRLSPARARAAQSAVETRPPGQRNQPHQPRRRRSSSGRRISPSTTSSGRPKLQEGLYLLACGTGVWDRPWSGTLDQLRQRDGLDSVAIGIRLPG